MNTNSAPGIAVGGGARQRRGRAPVVLARQHVHRSASGVDRGGLVPEVVLFGVEREVAAEHAGRSLRVAPADLAPARLGAARAGEPDHERGLQLVRHARVVEQLEPARLGARRALHGEHRAAQARPMAREVERDVAAHRAAHEHRALERELGGEALDELEEEGEREPVRLLPPARAVGRERLAVVRKIPGDHAEALREPRVLEQMPPLPAVRASGVLAEERHTRTGLLEVHGVARARDRQVEVAPDSPREPRHQARASRRISSTRRIAG